MSTNEHSRRVHSRLDEALAPMHGAQRLPLAHVANAEPAAGEQRDAEQEAHQHAAHEDRRARRAALRLLLLLLLQRCTQPREARRRLVQSIQYE